MARADDTAEDRWCARVAKVTDQSGPLVCRQVLKSLKFSLILGGAAYHDRNVGIFTSKCSTGMVTVTTHVTVEPQN
jgi:hypothetical protein